jgi:hypothetical protein
MKGLGGSIPKMVSDLPAVVPDVAENLLERQAHVDGHHTKLVDGAREDR